MKATNLHHSHKYNQNGPVGYFLTFRSYGTWLHGDSRSSIDRMGHNNIPGTPVLSPNEDFVRLETRELKQPKVSFSNSQRKSIEITINNVCVYNNWILHALSVRTEHVHVIVSGFKRPETIMNSLKSWCTRRMREESLWKSSYSPWSRHGSTRYLWNEKDVMGACNYVIYCQN